MSSSRRKTKKVICDCPKCNGRLVDPRTQQEHISLPDMGIPTRITTQSTSSKRKRVEEPLPEFQKPDSSESEDSEDKGSDSNDSEDDDSEGEDSESEGSDNNGSEDDDSKSSGSDNSNDSTTSKSDEEVSTGSSTDAISLFLEDDFDEQSPLSRRTAKEKFKQILSDADDEEEMSIDPSLEGLLHLTYINHQMMIKI